MDNNLLRAKIAKMTNGHDYALAEHREFVANVMQTKFANGLRHLPSTGQRGMPAVIVTHNVLPALVNAITIPISIDSHCGDDYIVSPKVYGDFAQAAVAVAAENTADALETA